MNRRFFCSLILAGAAESGYPKALVVYDTWSGNTQAIAEEMASNLRCSAVGLNNLIGYTISDYDLLVGALRFTAECRRIR